MIPSARWGFFGCCCFLEGKEEAILKKDEDKLMFIPSGGGIHLKRTILVLLSYYMKIICYMVNSEISDCFGHGL